MRSALLFVIFALAYAKNGITKKVPWHTEEYQMKGPEAIQKSMETQNVQSIPSKKYHDTSLLPVISCPSGQISVTSSWSFPPTGYTFHQFLTAKLSAQKYANLFMAWSGFQGLNTVASIAFNHGSAGCLAGSQDGSCKATVPPSTMTIDFELGNTTLRNFSFNVNVDLAPLPPVSSVRASTQLSARPGGQPAYVDPGYLNGIVTYIYSQNTVVLYGEPTVNELQTNNNDWALPYTNIFVYGTNNTNRSNPVLLGTSLNALNNLKYTGYKVILLFPVKEESASGLIVGFDSADIVQNQCLYITILFDDEEWAVGLGIWETCYSTIISWSRYNQNMIVDYLQYNSSKPLIMYPGTIHANPANTFGFLASNTANLFPALFPGKAWTMVYNHSISFEVSFGNPADISDAFPGREGYIITSNYGYSSYQQWADFDLYNDTENFQLTFTIANGISNPWSNSMVQINVDGRNSSLSLSQQGNIGKSFTFIGEKMNIKINGGNTTNTGTFLKYWVTDPNQQGPCTPGWSYYQPTSKCYKVFDYEYTNSFDAAAVCYANSAYLVSIHSSDENNFLMNLAETGLPGSTSLQTLVGLKQTTGGQMRWSDGTAVDYINWNAKQPNYNTGQCVVLYTDGGSDGIRGKWSSVDCNQPIRSFICKTNASR